jgi:nicotinamidase-related amidase
MFAGVNIDQCVMCTLQDANFLGYYCILIQDCAATTSPDFCREATLYNIKQYFVCHLVRGVRRRAGEG